MPGVVETIEEHGETTLVVDPARLVEACLHLRDELGFAFLSDVSAVDYLGWGSGTGSDPGSDLGSDTKGVSGYWGGRGGRDLNSPGTWALQRLPRPKPKRFSVAYHLLRLERGAPRVRVKIYLDEGEPAASVISVWPTADWHEREAWDLMGIPFQGHPNLQRILLDEDWEGHPLRKDYPIGGEPVRFSGEE